MAIVLQQARSVAGRARLIGVGLCAAVACSHQPDEGRFPAPAASPVRAEVTAADADGVSVRTFGATTPERLTWSGPELPRYRRDVVRPTVHRCDPAVGDRVLITRMDGAVLSLRRQTGVQDGSPRYELCHVGTYFDFAAPSGTPPRERFYALSMALSTLEEQQLPDSVFILGTADESVHTPSRREEPVGRRPELRPTRAGPLCGAGHRVEDPGFAAVASSQRRSRFAMRGPASGPSDFAAFSSSASSKTRATRWRRGSISRLTSGASRLVSACRTSPDRRQVRCRDRSGASRGRARATPSRSADASHPV